MDLRTHNVHLAVPQLIDPDDRDRAGLPNVGFVPIYDFDGLRTF